LEVISVNTVNRLWFKVVITVVYLIFLGLAVLQNNWFFIPVFLLLLVVYVTQYLLVPGASGTRKEAITEMMMKQGIISPNEYRRGTGGLGPR
jgi:hypothetical protein